jgi:hypothetical protein
MFDVRLPLVRPEASLILMATVDEIEAAIERLPMEKVRELAAWLEDYQATISASAAVFEMLDAEEGPGDQWQDTK